MLKEYNIESGKIMLKLRAEKTKNALIRYDKITNVSRSQLRKM